MSRVFTDDNFLSWEAYASGGKFGLAKEPKVVFQCLSAPDRRARYVTLPGDNSDAEGVVHEMSDERLRELFSRSRELD